MNQFTETSLQGLLDAGHTKAQVARWLGMSRAAVVKAITAKRCYRFECDQEGVPIGFYEIKRPQRGVNAPEAER